MFPFVHRSNDEREGEELLLFGAQERLRLEEGNHALEKSVPLANHEDQRGVAWTTMVLLDAPTTKPVLQQIEDLPTLRTLADVELGDQLPADPHSRVPKNGDVKTSLSVNEAG
jgi:hypothetical protein